MTTKVKTTNVNMPDGAVHGTSAYDAVESNTTQKQGTRALSVVEMLNGMTISSRLDSDAMNYINEIDRIIRDSKVAISSKPITTDGLEARLYVHDASRYAFLIIFADTFQSIDSTPSVSQIKSTLEMIAAGDYNVNVVQTIAVTKADYACVGNMAAALINSLMTLSGASAASKLTIAQLRELRITAITAIDKVRDYVRKVSPHAIADRDDIGVLFCVDAETKNPANPREVELRPFMAITGYTRIMNPQEAATGGQFVPIPTITNIVSSLSNSCLLAVALPFAAEAFIKLNLWQRPYTTFRSGSPNLGNLISDPVSKKPLFTDTFETFHAFLAQYMTNPFLAIDITEGRYRPVGIDTLINKPEEILNNINHFFTSIPIVEKDGTKHVIPPLNFGMRKGILTKFTNYTGSYVDKGIVKDTRYVDYLDMACQVQKNDEIKDLLLQPKLPQIRIERVRSIYTENTKSLYATTTVVLDAQAIIAMSKAIIDNHITINYDMPSSGNISMHNLLSSGNGNAFGDMASFGNVGQTAYNYSVSPYANIF